MGLPTEEMCKQGLAEFDKVMSMAETEKRGLINDMKDITKKVDELGGLYSAAGDLENAMTSAVGQIEAVTDEVTGLDGVTEAMDVAEACASDPISAFSNLKDSLFDEADNLIDTAFDQIPELDTTKALTNLLDKAGQPYGISDMIGEMDGVLTCLAGQACGTDVNAAIQTRIDSVDSLIEETNLTDAGVPDLDKVLADAGLPAGGHTEAMKNITEQANTSKGNISGKVDSAVTHAKSLSGGFHL